MRTGSLRLSAFFSSSSSSKSSKIGTCGARGNRRSIITASSNRPALHPFYTTKIQGEKGTKNYRVFLYNNQADTVVSPLHDVLLYGPSSRLGETIVRAVIEIPRGYDAKMEISKDEDSNPIKQDTKNGELRFMKHGKLPWNYGALPATYSSPRNHVLGVKYPGDNDPLDILDIGEKTWSIGNVVEVRVLGALCLIDQGEADWKIIGLNTNDPKAPFVHDARDLQFHFPGVVDQIREWYRVYKLAEGKTANTYAFNGELLGREQAREVIHNGAADYMRSTAYLARVQKGANAHWDEVVRSESHEYAAEHGLSIGEVESMSPAAQTDPRLIKGGPQVH